MIYDLKRKDPNKMQLFCFVVQSHIFCPSNCLALGQVINFSGVDTHTFAMISIPIHKNKYILIYKHKMQINNCKSIGLMCAMLNAHAIDTNI